VWAGTIRLRVGDYLVGVEFDTEATADAIRQRCAAWLDDSGRGLPAAFGVRTAPVGLLRRRVGLVHHGVPVRHRTPDLASAVETLATIVAGIATRPATGEVHVDARLLIRDGRAALLALPARVDLDDRPLRKSRIREVAGWRAVVDAATGEVLAGSGRLPIVAIVVADPNAGASLDESRRALWALGDGDRPGWAEFLDRRGDLILPVSEDKAVSTVAATLSA
jgi:hypothetical protein